MNFHGALLSLLISKYSIESNHLNLCNTCEVYRHLVEIAHLDYAKVQMGNFQLDAGIDQIDFPFSKTGLFSKSTKSSRLSQTGCSRWIYR
jgi:hypothetical protein